ncbi:MAG TPA: acetylxylan esterase [Armatimonadota bacterium]|jgi:dienelactone hydrolase
MRKQVVLWALLVLCLVPVMAADRQALFTVPDFRALPPAQNVINEIVLTEVSFAGAPFNGSPTRIYGFYARPAKPGKYPGVVQLHGAGLDVLKPDAAIFYAKHGFACLSIDWAGPAKERKEPRKPPYSKFDSPGNLAYEPESEHGKPWPTKWQIRGVEKDGITNGVRFVLRSFMYLRSRPEVNAKQLCLSGMSAGAHLSLLVLGQDPTIKAATVKYGEAFIRDLPGYYGGYFGPLTLAPKADQDAWLSVLDPKWDMPKYKANVLLLSGTDDIFFWMPIVLKTYREIPTDKRLLMLPNDNHSQVGNEEIPLRYFQSVLKTAPAYPTVTVPTVTATPEGLLLSVKVTAPSKLSKVVFITKRMPLKTFNWMKEWQTVPAELNGESWQAKVPVVADGEQMIAYAMVEDTTGAKISSDTVELPEYPHWRGK